MLARLSIRDIVLIDRLDIDFASGLSVLTGETGAGKSILLDAFALALGARGDATLVRQGAEQGQVTAMFELPAEASGARAARRQRHRRRRGADPAPRAVRRRPHPRLRQRPAGQRAGAAGARRGAGRDPRPARRPRAGRCRDAPPSARRLWPARGRCRGGRAALERAARRRGGGREAIAPRSSARRARPTGCAMRSRSWASSSPRPARRPRWPSAAPRMMQSEKVAGDLRDAHDAVAGSASPVPALSAAVRRLERRGAQAPTLVEPAVKALDAALNALDEARGASRARAARRRSRSAGAGADRGAAVRAARRRPQVQFAGRCAQRAGRETMPPISR